MPRVGGEGDGGGENERQSGGLAGWYTGGATRTMTGNTGNAYVVLGGTKYAIRLSQERVPTPAVSPIPAENPSESCQRKYCCRKSDSRERLTDTSLVTSIKMPTSEKIQPISGTGDCSCIGPRSRLPLPRTLSGLSASPSVCSSSGERGGGNNAGNSSSASNSGGGISSLGGSIGNAAVDRARGVVRVGGQSSPPPTSRTTTQSNRLPSNSNAINNCGGLQLMGSHGSQLQSSSSSSSSSSTTAAAKPAKASTNSTNAVLSTCAFAPTTINSVSVPRQIAHWTKHHSVKIQEQNIPAVDRLHRFRWSGGGGGNGKKSSSGPRSDKAERLRELTEKLKSTTAPVPPPRKPSRLHASPPPPPPSLPTQQANHNNHHHHHYHQYPQSITNRSTPRNYIYNEDRAGLDVPNTDSNRNNSNERTLERSTSVDGDDYHEYSTVNPVGDEKPSTWSLRTSWSKSSPESAINKKSGDDNDQVRRLSSDAYYSEPKHLRQYSDSLVVDSAKCADHLFDLANSIAAGGTTTITNPSVSGFSSESEARDAVTTLEPRTSLLTFHRTGVPFRSASFGQVDFNQGNRHRTQPISNVNRVQLKDVRASTLPRRRSGATSPGAASQNSPNPESPRASIASVDSAVGSTEGLGTTQTLGEEVRPRSDGSDSLATSSALTSPEPPVLECREPSPINSVQPDPCADDKEDKVETKETDDSDTKDRLELHQVIITPPSEESLLSQTVNEPVKVPSAKTPEVLALTGKVRRYRGDTSKRRKGVYITQWPEPSENDRNNLSAQSSEEKDEKDDNSKEEKEEKDDLPATLSDVSDCEGHVPRRYSKRPLRGPYGQMLEAEMAKPRIADSALSDSLGPKRKVSANLSYSAGSNSNSEPPTPCHHRATSSPSKLEGLPGPSPELLAQLLRGSSERVARAPTTHRNDTRTHVVVELYDTEKSYVEALQILVNKYLHTLKSSENSGLVDSATVDEIFYQVPAILSHHEVFLQQLRKRLDTWEVSQTIGDVFLDVFTKPAVLETYTLFLDNWKAAKKAIKATCQSKPAFARFLETMEREHKGKLGLDQLLIKPVQKIPRYELLIQRLLKHTDTSHPDYELLIAAQKEVHELVVKINCTERESLEWEQQQTTLREVQSLVEGLAGIVTNDRAFIRHDLVTIASNQGTRKERALFLFSDLLVITSIKRRSGTIRKPLTSSCPNSLVGLLEANKYKLLMRISLDDLEIMKAKDKNLRKMAREVDHLREDCATLSQLQELAATLHGSKHQLEDIIKEMLSQTQRQLADRNTAHSQLACLEFTLNTQSGMENISIIFTKPDKRASWEESFNEAKQKLALSSDKRPCPEFVGPLPIRKTRAGLQFTCAAPTITNGQGSSDVWVCNSDGYVGQVCVLSLSPEPPQVTSCNGVCNARILCVAGIPAKLPGSQSNTLKSASNIINNNNNNNNNMDGDISLTGSKSGISISIQDTDASGRNIQLDSSSSSDDSDSDEITRAIETAAGSMYSDLSSIDGADEDTNQPTMWLGTEDGCIHVYNCNDNIRIKKNKIKIQHGSSVHSIIYLDNKVFVALSNGDIVVYSRDQNGWNTSDPMTVSVGTTEYPVTKMVPVSVNNKLWCSCHNTIKIINIVTLEIEHTFNVGDDNARPVSCIAASGSLGVWISLHNSAVLKLYHATSYECLSDVNIAPAVTKMLAICDDIIKRHKAACLRVTALLACNDLLWIGTSAGVLLRVPIPHIKASTQRLPQAPSVTEIPHGHTGHVRFLTCVEAPSPTKVNTHSKINRYSLKIGKTPQTSSIIRTKLLVISGGDGYEDFRGPQASAELQAGREDSTNHLLLWKV